MNNLDKPFSFWSKSWPDNIILFFLYLFIAAIMIHAGEKLGLCAESRNYMPVVTQNSIADAIYRVEGSKTYPYGIKSVKTNGDAKYARKICLNTIRNNYKRWQDAGSKGEYIDFLANKYCPIKDDAIGNKRWKLNMKKLLAKHSA